MKIRPATTMDMPWCEEIYAHHVLHGVATMDEVPPDSGHLEAKRANVVQAGYPFLIIESAGKVLGYAYAAPFRARSAYRFAAEDSIYIHPAHVGQGLARPLLNQIILHARDQGLKTLIAVIGMDQDQIVEAYPSVRAHANQGFQHTGCLDFVGFKFDRWLKTVYMQLDLGTA